MASNTNTAVLLIILIISGVVIFALGAGGGAIYMYVAQKPAGASQSPGQASSLSAENLAKSLKSPAVSSLVFLGEVKSVSGRTIVITKDGQDVSFSVADNAKFSMVDYSSKTPVERTATLMNIKAGDNITASVKVLAGNIFSAVRIAIFPAKK